MVIAFSREWGFPDSETFSIPPIGRFVHRYINGSKLSIDPFARDSALANITNDLNKNTKAQYHLTAEEFLAMLRDKDVHPDLVLFDPPYNLSQLKECYQNIGKEFGQYEAQYGGRWIKERHIIQEIQPTGGIVLTFGWSTSGMGLERGYEIVEILLCAHGGAHSDTICMAERKVQSTLF